MNYFQAFVRNFLGSSPLWYKRTIVLFLLINPPLYFGLNALGLPGGYIAGWVLMIQFIFTLAMALRCYPLQPGGLLALQALMMGLSSPESVYQEIVTNLPVILLLMFMVAGVFYLRDLLLYAFARLLLAITSPTLLSLIFMIAAGVLSAFLDALTVTAVLISVCGGFYSVYHRVANGIRVEVLARQADDEEGQESASDDGEHDLSNDRMLSFEQRGELDQFRAFLRGLLMHSLVGTALGGVMTLVGEPQNLIIAKYAGWNFIEFFQYMAPVAIPAAIAGVVTLLVVERLKLFGFGQVLPTSVVHTLEAYNRERASSTSKRANVALVVQTISALLLVIALMSHVAEVGLIGLMLLILLTSFNGVVEEHKLGESFVEALPFATLLVVFFAIVSVIHQQHLFTPVTDWVLSAPQHLQPSLLFVANGILSAISDNVFVATVYASEINNAMQAGEMERSNFDLLAIAINTGTNLPSIATPNGQAAFLFMLTSSLAPLIRLSYMRMLYMALPYTLVVSTVAFVALYLHST